MAAAKTVSAVSSSSSDLDRVMEALIASRGTKSASKFTVSGWLADQVADSGRGLAAVTAGASAGVENFVIERDLERNRQTRRTAARILASAQQ